MYRSGNANLRDCGDYILQVLSRPREAISRWAAAVCFGRGARLSDYDCEHIEGRCIAAGLPVIDNPGGGLRRRRAARYQGLMVAVGEEASPPAYHALSFAPLGVVTQACRAPAPRSSTSLTRRGRPRKSERKAG